MNLIKKIYPCIKLMSIFLMVLLGTSLGMRGTAQEIGLSVVANGDGVPDNLTSDEMKKIFLGQQQSWSNNKIIKIAMLKPDTEIGAVVSDKLYGMTPNELKKYWLAMAFQGRAKTPKFFDSADELKHYISSTQGSIGIIEYALEENLKFVDIDNKSFF